MENSTSNRNGVNKAAGAVDGWEAWDAVPRDGPAVFVIDTAAADHGVVHGRWLMIADGQTGWHANLTDLLGREPDEGSWAVVDQIGLGPVMAPETMSVVDLAVVAQDLRTRSSG